MENIYNRGNYVVFIRPYIATYGLSDSREFKIGEKLKIVDKTIGTIYFQDGSYIAYFGKENAVKVFTNEIDALEFSESIKETSQEPEVNTVKDSIYRENDTITFMVDEEPFHYKVTSTHLECNTDIELDFDDDTIFWELELSDKIKFLCEKAYGYTPQTPPMDGIPRYRTHDYKAATRLINEIKALCRAYNGKNKTQQQDETIKLVNVENEISSYKQIYPFGSSIIFDTGKKSFRYEVGTIFLSSLEGWDAIYKELGVDPEKFIEKATGKKAISHYSFWGYKERDAVSSDLLIKALRFECTMLKIKFTTEPYSSSTLSVTKPQKNNVNLNVSFENALKYDKLEIFK